MSLFEIPKNSIHHKDECIASKEEGLYHIVPFNPLRATDKVDFQVIPFFEVVNGIDRVNHEPGAYSPSYEGGRDLWYMHPGQGDNLVVFSGYRVIELYSPEHGQIETFEVHPDKIVRDGQIIHDGAAMLGWPVGVFHRNHSPEGSTSINFAVRFDNFDLSSEFNIYKVDLETGEYHVVREGHLDQPNLK